MRRFGVIVGLLGLPACAAMQDAFSAHAEVAARAAGQTLTVERLATLAAHAKRVPLEQEALSTIAHVWVDYTTFVQRVAGGESLDDSAMVVAAAWPAVSQMKWEHFHDRLIADRIGLSDAQLDSAYTAGEQRMFQHILLRVPPSAPPTDESATRAQIESIRRQARAGGAAAFGRLAARYSDDEGTKERGGFLGLTDLDDPLVPEFKDAAWALEPGELSDVVRTSFGFHVIRRPPLAEIRDSFRVHLEDVLVFQFDSVYLDSLSTARRLRVRGGAPRIARQSVERLNEARTDSRTLATFRGGQFVVRDLVDWLFALDPQFAAGFASASDEQITQFIKTLAQRHILLLQADSAGVQLTPAEWEQVGVEHDSAVAVLERVLGVTPETLASAPGPDQRAQVAQAQVMDYLERLLNGRAQFASVPPFLATELRRGISWSVDQAAVADALARARTLRAQSDSLAAPANVPRMTPAPGPAPAPGGTPAPVPPS